MLIFRRLLLKDLDIIYNDEALKPLLTVDSKGEKFGAIMELDGVLKGGVSGYIDGDGAMIQQLILKDHYACKTYEDGLVRSLMHILDLDGVKLLFIEKKGQFETFKGIGFREYCSDILKPDIHLGDTIVNDITKYNTIYINLEYFFKRSSCSCS